MSLTPDESAEIDRAITGAFEHATESLFQNLDDVADIFDLSDEDLLRLVRPVLGSDLTDMYREWIAEGV